MDNFKAIYKILSALEASMDLNKANLEMFDATTLEVSKERWNKYIELMVDCGYVKGVRITPYINGNVRIDCSDIQITLKGLEYLQENSLMRKAYKIAKGIADITP